VSTTGTDRTTAWALRVLGAIVVLAAAESIAAALAARDPSPVMWPALADAIADRDDDDPVFVAQDWLGPTARMHVAAAAELTAVTHPDLHGVPRFHMIGWGDDGSKAIARALEGGPVPSLVQRREYGPLVWSTWTSPSTDVVLQTLTSGAVEVTTSGGPCRGRGTHRCAEGEVRPRIIEVDYRPRACLATAVSDGTTVRMRWPNVQLGERLRGHVGMGDFNARLRNDAPVRVVVRIGTQEVLRRTVTDLQGWSPLEIATDPGVAAVEVELTASLGGSFGAKGYDGTHTRSTCIELRTIGGAP